MLHASSTLQVEFFWPGTSQTLGHHALLALLGKPGALVGARAGLVCLLPPSQGGLSVSLSKLGELLRNCRCLLWGASWLR
jgi:hypothetical protein